MIAWLAMAALTLVDPSGDTLGAGDLAPPTAAVYQSLASFDLSEVSVLEGEPLRVRVALAALDNPAGLPHHVSLPIIEVYLDVEEGGEEELLPGSGMRMPQGEGWEIALRITGDEAFAVRAREGERVRHPVLVSADGDALIVETPFAAPERARLHALTGVYDPFGETGWRAHERQPSPWSFSSPVQAPPVVDVLAPDGPAQRLAIRNRELPEQPRGVPGAPWVVLMVVGMVVAGVGLGLRRTAPGTSESEVGDAKIETEPIVLTGADPVADELLVRGPAAAPAALDWSEEHGWMLEEPETPEVGEDTRPETEGEVEAEVEGEPEAEVDADDEGEPEEEAEREVEADVEEEPEAEEEDEHEPIDVAGEAPIGEGEHRAEREDVAGREGAAGDFDADDSWDDEDDEEDEALWDGPVADPRGRR